MNLRFHPPQAWKRVAKEGGEAKAKMLQCLNYMRNRKLSAAITTWRAVCEEARDLKQRAQAALRRMLNTKLYAAFNTWFAWLAERRKQEADMRRAVLRMVNQKLSGALATWREYVRLFWRTSAALQTAPWPWLQLAPMERVKLSKLFLRLSATLMVSAVRSKRGTEPVGALRWWRTAASTSKHGSYSMKKAVSRMSTSSYTWTRWMAGAGKRQVNSTWSTCSSFS